MTSMLQRIAAAAACALLLACPASGQLIGSGHVMGNGTASPAAPTDTPLVTIMGQSGSGIGSGVPTILGVAAGSAGSVAKLGAAPVNGQCASFNSSGGLVPAGGACTVGGGGGTVSAATIPATGPPALPPPLAVYTGSAGSSSTTVAGLAVVPPGNGGAQCTPFETFGGGTSVSAANNVTAFNSAITQFSQAGSVGGCLGFGAGVYQFASIETVTFPANNPWVISLRGVGHDLTTLEWTATGGGLLYALSKNNHGFEISDLTIATGVANGGNGLQVTCLFAVVVGNCAQTFAHKSIHNVTFKGIDGPAGADYWTADFANTGVSQVNVENVNTFGGSGNTGVGFVQQGYAAGSSYSFSMPISNTNFNGMNIGILLGDWWQGVSVTNSNFGSLTGVLVNGSATGLLTDLSIVGSQFSTAGASIQMASPVLQFNLNANYFLTVAGSSSFGVICSPTCEGGIVANNTFSNGVTLSNQTAILIAGNSSFPLLITGNTFQGYKTGIGVTAGSLINLQSNAYAGNTTNISNSAGVITAGSCAGIGGTCTAGATP